MMASTLKAAASAFALAILGACGGGAVPEAIPRVAYPADEEFRLTLVMHSCPDLCVSYGESTCDVDVDPSTRTISVEVSISSSREDGDCSGICGPVVLAHCTIPSLEPGRYIVEAEGFAQEITLE